jgi:hypothetical protein
MVMKLPVLFAVWMCAALATGCDKPSSSECKRAIGNIRTLMGTAQMSIEGSADAAWIRSCRGAAKKSSVTCAIEAKSLDALKACGLLKGKQLEEIDQLDRDLQKLRPGKPTSAPVGSAAPAPAPIGSAAPAPTTP